MGEAAGTLTNMIIREYVHDILGAIKGPFTSRRIRRAPSNRR